MNTDAAASIVRAWSARVNELEAERDRLAALNKELVEALEDLAQIVDFQINPPSSNPIRFSLNEARAVLAKVKT